MILMLISLLENILSQDFHNKVCKILNVSLVNESVAVRKTVGDYRIAREAMYVTNLKTDKDILDVHYDSEVTIWTGLLYFSDSNYGGHETGKQFAYAYKREELKAVESIFSLGTI